MKLATQVQILNKDICVSLWNNAIDKGINPFVLFLAKCMYLKTPRPTQDVTQDQFLSGV